MTRIGLIDVITRNTDFYHAKIDVEHVLDAVEWCENHPSNGIFFIKWGYLTGDIFGTFGFSESEDHTTFSLRWC